MFSPEELAERRKTIGASEVPAVLGVDAYKTPLQLYSEKLGLVEPSPDSEAAEAGRVLEEPIAQWYARRTGATLAPSPTLFHPQHPWASATPDRDSVRPDREAAGIVEVKNRNEYAKDDFGQEDSDELPTAIVAQVCWQMMVRDVPWADVAVLIGGNKLRIYTVWRDPALEARIFQRVEAFWFGNVQAQVPPTPTALDNEGMKKLFPTSAGPLKDGSNELLVVARELQDIKAEQKGLEAQRDEHEALLKLGIGDGEGLAWPNGAKVTWKNNAPSEKTDWKVVAEKLGAIVGGEEYDAAVKAATLTVPGPRVLRVKLPKED